MKKSQDYLEGYIECYNRILTICRNGENVGLNTNLLYRLVRKEMQNIYKEIQTEVKERNSEVVAVYKNKVD